MRAVEAILVLEEDDGKTYVRTFKTGDPRLARRALEVVRDVFLEYGNVGSSIGPVLRKMTEVEGWPDCDFPGTIVLDKKDGEANAVEIDCVVPEGCIAKTDDLDPPSYRFRFDVTAVRVEEAKP